MTLDLGSNILKQAWKEKSFLGIRKYVENTPKENPTSLRLESDFFFFFKTFKTFFFLVFFIFFQTSHFQKVGPLVIKLNGNFNSHRCIVWMEIEWAATLGSKWLLFTPLHLLFHAARQWEFCARNHSVYKTRLCTKCTPRSVRLWHSGEHSGRIYESLIFVIWACWKTRLGNVRRNTLFILESSRRPIQWRKWWKPASDVNLCII